MIKKSESLSCNCSMCDCRFQLYGGEKYLFETETELSIELKDAGWIEDPAIICCDCIDVLKRLNYNF